MARERVSFRFEAEAHTVEGQLLAYLRNHKLINHREALLRALKAYYLPWVYEDEMSEDEVRSLAESAIEDLEFRIFQIRKHFFGDAAPATSAATTSAPETAQSNGQEPQKVSPTTSSTDTESASSAAKLSVQDVINSNVDPAVLDDFDDF